MAKRHKGDAFRFFRDPDSDQFVWCWSNSGETFELSIHGCECEDFYYRLRKRYEDVYCKHWTAWQRFQVLGLPLEEFTLIGGIYVPQSRVGEAGRIRAGEERAGAGAHGRRAPGRPGARGGPLRPACIVLTAAE